MRRSSASISTSADEASASATFHLVVTSPPGMYQYKAFPLSKSPTIIGRDRGCDIPIDRTEVSRRHAELVRHGDGWLLRDLKSSNGTFVDDERIEEITLRAGMQFQIVHTEFSLLRRGDPALARFQRYYRDALRDELTGLPNANALDEYLSDIRDNSDAAVALILLEVDDFHKLNKEFGRAAGDQILMAVATKLPTVVTSGEVFRAGGPRLAVVVQGMPVDMVEQYAVNLCEPIRDFTFQRENLRISLSSGIAAVANGSHLDVARFVRNAENVLERALRLGGGRTWVDNASSSFETLDSLDKTSVGIELDKLDPNTTGNLRKPYLRHALRRFQGALQPGAFLFALEVSERQLLAVTKREQFEALERTLDAVLRERFKRAPQEENWMIGEGLQGHPVLVALQCESVANAKAVAVDIASTFSQRCADKNIEGSLTVGTPVRVGLAAESIAEAMRVMELSKHPIGALPLPIGHALRLADEASSADQFFALIRLHQAITRWFVSVLAAELLKAGSLREPPKTRLAELLGQPVTDHGWVMVLRAYVECLKRIGAADLAFPAYFAMMTTGDERALRELEEFATVRNRFAHGQDVRATEFCEHWGPRLRALLTGPLADLTRHPPMYVARIENLEEDVFDIYFKQLIGDNLATQTKIERRTRSIPSGRIILSEGDKSLALTPFALYLRCPACHTEEVFFLDQLHRARGPSFKSVRAGAHTVARLAEAGLDARYAKTVDEAMQRALNTL